MSTVTNDAFLGEMVQLYREHDPSPCGVGREPLRHVIEATERRTMGVCARALREIRDAPTDERRRFLLDDFLAVLDAESSRTFQSHRVELPAARREKQ